MSAKRTSVAIAGAGGLARALARALGRSDGARVTIAARRPPAAAAIARGARGVRAARRFEDAVADAAIVILAVPDRAIAPLARRLAPLRGSWRGVVALHAAGAYGPELLAGLAARGASTGVLHPLAVLGPAGGAGLTGAYARIEGAPRAAAAARRLCALAGLLPLRGPGLQTPGGRRAYHAAASLASNDVIALLAAARRLFVGLGIPERDAQAALLALARGALRQSRRAGLAGALTGPVVRNDAATLTAQLRALGGKDASAAEAHRALSLTLVELAVRSGRLGPEAERSLRRLLTRGRGRVPTV